jgi:hypothetical protein
MIWRIILITKAILAALRKAQQSIASRLIL